MNNKTNNWIDNNLSYMIKDLQSLVRIKSVENYATTTPSNIPAPFGLDVRAVEDTMIKIAKEHCKMNVWEYGGYYVVVDEGTDDESNKEMLGIITHLDVVPEGDGWSEPPYAANIINGNTIVGRGTVDDKGPAIASLYALKAVKECGYKFKRKVRLIFGLNEETNMLDISKYIEREQIPDISFTPDGYYPLGNSEFSICHVTISKKYNSNIIFNSGDAPNIVPATAEANVKNKNYKTLGIQCHASKPWDGENAAQKMISVLYNQKDTLEEEDTKVITILNKYLGDNYYGESFGLNFEDKTGKLTCNLGVVKWDHNGFQIILDLRCPNAVKKEDVRNKLQEAFLECDAEISNFEFEQGYYLSPESEIVNKLMKVYQENTGDYDSKPLTMGGGTYAKSFPNSVSFGPEGIMDICGCHVPNEYITFDQLSFTCKMIADAIISLACE